MEVLQLEEKNGTICYNQLINQSLNVRLTFQTAIILYKGRKRNDREAF